jgi:hypothetical protein
MTQLVVPAYFHPAVRGADWEALAGMADRVRLVVLNVASGVGTLFDPAFLPALDRLRAAGVAIAGYIDTDYAHRPGSQVLPELELYQERYGVSAVFFDRVSALPGDVGHYAGLAAGVRSAGVSVVAFNHGAHPVEAYAEHGDLLGTFEGPWSSYVDIAVPRWVRARPAGQFFHLVHSVPPWQAEDGWELARKRNAGAAYLTSHSGDNPWDRLDVMLGPV